MHGRIGNKNNINNNNNIAKEYIIQIQKLFQKMTVDPTILDTAVTVTTTTATATAAFPIDDLLPKSETNALEFASTIANGENVTIGILDTGIDPGIPTLRYNNNYNIKDGGTTTKTPKLLNVVDCTGSGDVSISEQSYNAIWCETQNCWQVTGLTGRILKLNKDWKILPFPKIHPKQPATGMEEFHFDDNDDDDDDTEEDNDNEDNDDKNATATDTTTNNTTNTNTVKSVPVRLGVKRAYELFPKTLQNRVKAERKLRLEEHINQHISTVHARKAQLESEIHQQHQQKKPPMTTLNQQQQQQQQRELDDLNARLEILTSKHWYTEDPGPVYDCIVFWDGEHYRAVIDVNENGNVQDQIPMTDYDLEYQYGTFGTVDQMNYAIHIYPQGTTTSIMMMILSIVCDVTPHGTHVASIAADAIHGVAPNAKLVSLKIGDTRLNGMETGAALTRALIEAIRHKCDVINVSYGEDVVLVNTGRFQKLVDELVWKHNIVFCASAGNDGPALSTVEAPGGSLSACIGVAAYVSPNMMKSMYSIPFANTTTTNSNNNNNNTDNGSNDGSDVNEDTVLPGTTFTWSSTGPALDGDNGVNITAPGAAITNVSNWCLQKSMLMNGTSMSSPHATGCVALLISACKANGIPVSPARIRRALENTAKNIPTLSTLQQGWGMIQVDKAWEYLQQFKNESTEDVYFAVEITSKRSKPRGVYLRQPEETSVKQAFTVGVNPQFRREDVVSEETQRRKIEFEMHCSIQSTEPSWVTAPEHFVIVNKGREFKIEVDPTNLEPGVHTARVNGYHSSNLDRKVIFSIPITVVKPITPIPKRVVDLGDLEFQPAEVKRFFVVPPAGSTWMDVTLRDLRSMDQDEDATSRLLILHTVQLVPHASYRKYEKHKRISMLPSQTNITSIAVEQGKTVEVNLSRFWSTLGSTAAKVSIQFRSIRPVPDQLFIQGGSYGEIVRINTDLADETVLPTATLNKWQTPIRPTQAIIMPLGERDIFPSHQKEIYQLVLTYEFEQEEKGSFVPRAPGLQGVLYESSYESQLMMAFDGDKKYLGTSDANPGSISAPKGTITVRCQVRHDDVSKLEKLKDMVLWIERKLSKEISLTAYHSKEDLMDGKNAFKKLYMKKGACVSVFFSEPAYSKLPSKCKPGDLLLGSMTFGTGDTSLPGENKRPGGFPVRYTVGPKAKKESKEAEPPEPEDERATEEKLNDSIRDLKVEYLNKLSNKEKEDGKFEELYDKFEAEYPKYLPLRMAKLKYLDSHKKRSEKLPDIIAAAEAVLSCISEDEIALAFGRKVNNEDPKAVKHQNEIKKKKEVLVESLSRMALAYSEMRSEESFQKFTDTMKRLNEWSDIDDILTIERETIAGRLGTVLQIINKMLAKEGKESKSSNGAIKPMTRSELLEKRADIFEKLGYTLFVEYDKRTRVIECPDSYTLF